MRAHHRGVPLFLLAVIPLTACDDRVPAHAEALALADGAHRHVAEFTAVNYAFLGPAEIPSGWVTFRMPNPSDEHHVIVLVRLPEGVSFAEWQRAEEHRGRTGEVPEWWGERVEMGGPGALAPGLVGETTMRLDPGEYVMFCGVPTADGTLHSELGMVKALTVTERDSGATEPEAAITLTLRSHEFALDGEITPGRHTVRVHFEEQPAEGGWHDVHVARLGGDLTVDGFGEAFQALIAGDSSDLWFIGGAEQLPAGHNAYFTADFEAGRYAWWCHYHSDKGMVQGFEVAG